MKRLPKIGCLVVALVMLFYQGFMGTVSACASVEQVVDIEKRNYITEQAALYIAENFVEDSWQDGLSYTWDENSYLNINIQCYDMNDNISAYVFDVSDSMTETNEGYIVVGASRVYCPIIEYSETAEFPFEEYLEDGDKLIYEGGTNYYGYDRTNEQLYLCNPDHVKVMKQEITKVTSLNEKVTEQWEQLNDSKISHAEQTIAENAVSVYSDYGRASTTNKIEVTPLPQNFYVMTKFKNATGYVDSCCAPTAAINLMFYYYCKNTSYYSSLKVGGSNVDNTFAQISKLMKTDENGTRNDLIAPAIKSYLRDKTAFDNSTTSYMSLVALNATQMVNDLRNNKPVILILKNHERYGNHAVVCVGIREYDNGNIYYTLADGWYNYLRTMNAYGGNAEYTDAVSVHLFK